MVIGERIRKDLEPRFKFHNVPISVSLTFDTYIRRCPDAVKTLLSQRLALPKSQSGCPLPSQSRERSRALRASLGLAPPVRVTLQALPRQTWHAC